MELKRERFNSSFGVIAACAGSAIGLGNLWSFPYKVGQNGGGVFVIFYLIAIVLIAMPIFIIEFTIGKNGRSDCVRSITYLEDGGKKFALGGILGIFSSIIILSFYSVVAGWAVIYFYEGILYGYSSYSPDMSLLLFDQRTGSVTLGVVVQTAFMILTVSIVIGGVKDGIEKICKILLPLLFGCTILLNLYTLTLSGALEGYKFLFIPNIVEAKEVGFSEIAMTAIAQAFFTLSIGCGAVLTYGSYTADSEDVISISKKVVFLDTVFTLISALSTFAIIFTYNIDYSEGSSLMFISLPVAFNQMYGGRIVGVLFFFLVMISAITSAFSLLENLIAHFMNTFKIDRKIVSIVVGVFVSIIGIACQYGLDFGFGFLDWTGETRLLEQLDGLTVYLTLPLCALFMVIFGGHKMNKNLILNEFTNKKIALVFYNYVKYILPVIMLIVYLVNLYKIL